MRRSLQIGLVMTIFNLTNPGVIPVTGDFIRIVYANGIIEEKHYTP